MCTCMYCALIIRTERKKCSRLYEFICMHVYTLYTCIHTHIRIYVRNVYKECIYTLCMHVYFMYTHTVFVRSVYVHVSYIIRGACANICLHSLVYVCMYVCMYECVCMHERLFLNLVKQYACVHRYLSEIHVYIYVHTHIHVYIYIYIYIYI